MERTKQKLVIEQPVVEQTKKKQEVTKQTKTKQTKDVSNAIKKLNLTQLKEAVEAKHKVSVKSYSLCVGLDGRGQQKTESVFRAFVDKEMFEITFDTYKKFNSK